MSILVSVKLPDIQHKSVKFVKTIKGYDQLDIDENYGVVIIDPFDNLYAIRVNGEIDEKTRQLVLSHDGMIYSDPQIATSQVNQIVRN